jgi:hypothetical protein
VEAEKKPTKWKFDDYAFALTGVIVVALLGPELLDSIFGTNIAGEDMGLRALSPMLFMVTTVVCFWKDTYDAWKTGGYRGTLFTHTFRSLLEDAIYMTITTIMVYGAIFADMMLISWLAGPITWVLFLIIFPLVRRKKDKVHMPWRRIGILSAGIAVEIFTQAWVAFPLAWLIICVVELVHDIHTYDRTPNSAFQIMYHGIAVVVIAVGLIFGNWLMSWAAFPAALLVCWVMAKVGLLKKPVPSE